MSTNLGPLVLTVIQFVSAGVGYLVVVTWVPTNPGNRGTAVLIGVVTAAVVGTSLYYRQVRPRLPPSLLGVEEDREPIPKPDSLTGDDPPGAIGADDLPGPDEGESDGEDGVGGENSRDR